jgi:hypothetical protein
LRRLISSYRASIAVAGVAASLLLAAPPLYAQSVTSGMLEGIVIDAAGQPLRGVRIQVTETTTGVAHSLRTDASGDFRRTLLPPGEYEVFAEELGYQPKLVTGVFIHPGRRAS